jgi:hypothetical protein
MNGARQTQASRPRGRPARLTRERKQGSLSIRSRS